VLLNVIHMYTQICGMFCKCCNVCFNMSYLKAESIYNEEDEEDIADEDLEEDDGDDGDQVLYYTIPTCLLT
jgi:hypothetical protein